MVCVSETNGLKRKNNDEKLDFKELEEVIGIVQERRKSLYSWFTKKLSLFHNWLKLSVANLFFDSTSMCFKFNYEFWIIN